MWKPIAGYDNYMVSSFGRVKSLNYNGTKREKILKPCKNRKGYLRVALFKNRKGKWFRVHRIVAQSFIPNPDNLPQVNHINEFKTDNSVWNLEWCTNEYNHNYGTRNERAGLAQTNHPSTSKSVVQLDLLENFIREWPSAMEAQRNGFHNGNINSCCKGRYKTHKGYRWMYAEEYYAQKEKAS